MYPFVACVPGHKKRNLVTLQGNGAWTPWPPRHNVSRTCAFFERWPERNLHLSENGAMSGKASFKGHPCQTYSPCPNKNKGSRRQKTTITMSKPTASDSLCCTVLYKGTKYSEVWRHESLKMENVETVKPKLTGWNDEYTMACTDKVNICFLYSTVSVQSKSSFKRS